MVYGESSRGRSRPARAHSRSHEAEASKAAPDVLNILPGVCFNVNDVALLAGCCPNVFAAKNHLLR